MESGFCGTYLWKYDALCMCWRLDNIIFQSINFYLSLSARVWSLICREQVWTNMLLSVCVCVTPSLQILKRLIDEDSHPTKRTVCLLESHPECFTAATSVKLRFKVEGDITTTAGVPSELFKISPSNRTQSGQDPQVC